MKYPRWLIKGDRVIWTIFFFLCIISLVEVFSATSTLVYKQGVWGPIFKHATFLFMGACLIVVVQNIPSVVFKSFASAGWLIVFACLVLVLCMQKMTNGAARWLDLGPFQFQPSEMAKGVIVVLVADALERAKGKNGYAMNVLKGVLRGTLPILILIGMENLSTTLILGMVIFLMLFIGRISNKQMKWIVLGLLIIGVGGATLAFSVPSSTYKKLEDKLPVVGVFTHRAMTWKSRIEKHGNDDNLANLDPYGKDAQRIHANIAIATSNVFGKVPGNSVERDFLSQAYSDFIYAIIVEELGLVGGIIVVALYICLLVRARQIAAKCTDAFSAYLVIGLTLLICIQALINMMVAVGLMPITGQPLPLISRGGTSTLFNCIYLGMILSVSREVRESQRQEKKKNDKNSLNTAIEVESEKKS